MRASRGDLALLPQGQDDYMSPSLKMPKGEVMTFWILTAALALATTAIFVRAALRGRDSGEPPAAYDLRVYRDQLKEIDRDAARGLIAAEEAERLRSEVSRRILAADTALTSGTASASAAKGPIKAMAALTALGLIGGAYGLYLQIGAPGYGDLSLKDRIAMAEEIRQTRPSQADVEGQVPPFTAPQVDANFLTLMERLRSAVAERPNDLQGHVLLARNEAVLGNFTAAYKAQGQILSIKGDTATAQDYADYADLMILAAGGYVSPEAETALNAAFARDQNNGPTRYYVGLMFAQTGRPDRAFRLWDALLKEGPPTAPWIAPIREQIEEMAQRAGVRYTLPADEAAPSGQPPVAGLPGPTGQDIENAAQMSDAERKEMIGSMVARLSDRLATEGGEPAEWARLIGALGVLGETERARAILAEAQEKFLGQTEALDVIRAAGRNAGLIE
jgi:cytochrome c-type biogenesis protein CcmH